MTPAAWPRAQREDARLLLIDARGELPLDHRVPDLPFLLRAGDLLVVNDAATLPASLPGECAAGSVEVRLAGQLEETGGFAAVLFGSGHWRQRTEDRPAPPLLACGTAIAFGEQLSATLERVSDVSPRLVELRFDRSGAELWPALYAVGRPVQYSYLCGPLELWHVQTAYGSRPWAMELPSAGRPLGLELLRALRGRGVAVHALTHAAGLSSTGDATLDTLLPLPELYEIPAETAAAVQAARAQGRRIVAVGTTVVRALESSAVAHAGVVAAGRGLSDLRLGPDSRMQVVDAILTGLHEPGTSHHRLLQAFVPAAHLDAAMGHAERSGYLCHEFGDLALVIASASVRPAAA